MKSITSLALVASIVTAGTTAMAQDVRITTFKSESTFSLNGRTYTITRNQDTTATVQGDFALTSRACPPDCIQPISAGDGVATYGELEVISFLENVVSENGGLLLDTRLPNAFAAGSIPGSVNVPASTLDKSNRYRPDILRALGAVGTDDDALNFDNAMDLVLFGAGPWSDDAFDTVENLLDAGYPPQKLFFYRGGMQGWNQLGLTSSQTPNPG